MGKPDISRAERPQRVRVGGVDVERMKIFRKRFPPAAKRHLYIRDEILAPMREPPANSAKTEMDPEAATALIKKMVREAGMDAVGIAEFDPRFTFAQAEQVEHRYVIVFGMAMQYDYMADIGPRSQDEVHRVYYRLDDVGVRVAQHIAAFGYTARMQPNGGEVPLPAYGWLAGLGELGKHGSLISPRLGSSFRLGGITTDMPLVADGPKDFGIDEVCTNCQMCTRFCPGDAIKPEKKTVNGIERWIVEREACEPYFHKMFGCKICLMVCPLNARGVFRDQYKALPRDLVKAKTSDGLLSLIDERTEMTYDGVDYGAFDEEAEKG